MSPCGWPHPPPPPPPALPFFLMHSAHAVWCNHKSTTGIKKLMVKWVNPKSSNLIMMFMRSLLTTIANWTVPSKDFKCWLGHCLSLKAVMHRASCLTLETNEFRCYEAKIEKWKGQQPLGVNPGYFWLELPVLCHWATTASRSWSYM